MADALTGLVYSHTAAANSGPPTTAVVVGRVVSHTAAANSGPPTAAVVVGRVVSADTYGGRFHVTGTTAIDGSPDTPVARKVRLFCNVSGQLARETFSDAAGDYAFTYVREGPWFVVSHDHTLTYNAVIADNLTGDPM